MEGIVNPEDVYNLDSFRTPVFRRCSMTCSGYSADERLLLCKLIQTHGGEFTGDMQRDVCTHLILDSNTGDKFKQVQQEWMHIKCVTMRWINLCTSKVGFI